jgi:CRISPR system Cascade subunit CasA
VQLVCYGGCVNARITSDEGTLSKRRKVRVSTGLDARAPSVVTVGKFNLVDESWIPVIMREARDGFEVREFVSLRDAFTRSATISRVHDSNPTVVASVYRLLFAVMHRAAPMQNESELLKAWREDCPFDKVDSYLTRWHDRFFLFGGERPFMQVPDLVGGKVFGWRKLSAKHNGATSKVLFDHSFEGDGVSDASAGEGARLLIATLMMTIVSGNSSLNEKAVYTVDAPVAKSMLVIPEGRNLAETLLVNTVFQTELEHARDLPAWEADAVTASDVLAANAAKKAAVKKITAPTTFKGVTERITWLSRSIKLQTSSAGDAVTGVEYAAGLPFVRNPFDRDPWVGYWIIEQKNTHDKELKAIGWSSDVATWRTLPTLMHGYSGDGASTVPALVTQNMFSINGLIPWCILVVGQAANKAKYLDAGMIRWRPPENVLQHTQLATLAQALRDAKRTARDLKRVEMNFAERVVTKPERDAFTKRIGLTPAFWWRLQQYFDKSLQEIDSSFDSDTFLERWRKFVVKAVSEAVRDVGDEFVSGSKFVLAWGAALNELNVITGRDRERTRGEGVMGDGAGVTDGFVSFVSSLNPSRRRILEDSLKYPPGSNHQTIMVLGGWLSSTNGEYSNRDKAYSLAAALQACSKVPVEKAHGDIGEAVSRALSSNGSPSVTNAFGDLLNASGDKLPHVTLSRLTRLMSDYGIAPDWKEVRNDLMRWGKQHGRIKIRWAQSFCIRESNSTQKNSRAAQPAQIEVDDE